MKPNGKNAGKLEGKIALITGGESDKNPISHN